MTDTGWKRHEQDELQDRTAIKKNADGCADRTDENE